jgi:hypothetical protein
VAPKKTRRQRRQQRPARAAKAAPPSAPAKQAAPQEPDEIASGDPSLKIDEPIIIRVLTDPKGYEPFHQFCCGKDRREEREVMLTVHNLLAGTTEVQQIAVLLEKDAPPLDHTGERPLIGICTVGTAVAGRNLPSVGVKAGDRGAAIGVVGTDLVYRKHVLQDGETRPGVALVTGTLKLIEQMFGGQMPFVRTNVLPTNEGSKPLFDEHYFENTGYPPQGVNPFTGEKILSDNIALFRPVGKPPGELRAPGWSKRPIPPPP